MGDELQLSRPLVVFDLETTGLDVKNDRIVEISCVKLNPDGSREVKTRRINPLIPISPQATAVHGITNEDVRSEPSFRQIYKGLLAFLDGCDLSGFNVEGFDLPLLVEEFGRVGVAFPRQPVYVIDSWRIFLAMEPRDLTAALRFYCARNLTAAHSAEADAVAAADVLLAQVARYDELPATADALHEFCHPVHPDWLDPDGRLVWRAGEACIGFGKHREKSLRRLVQEDPDYLFWIVEAEFSDQVKATVRDALRGIFPRPEDNPEL